jgi:hypothetical protein
MNDFLKKIGLYETYELTLPLSKQEFNKRLLAITEEGNPDIFATTFEGFKSGHKIFKGYVNENSFEIRRKRHFFDHYTNWSFAEGTIVEDSKNIRIEVEIKGLTLSALFLSVLLIGLTFIPLSLNIIKSNSQAVSPFYLVGLVSVMVFVIYMTSRNGFIKLKNDLDGTAFSLN